ncbi:MAG: cobaltochelatase subunit CobN, partial [Methanotrichaceae archaeon]|nr:cobaltochelatase subunit CobN [Methanotrichaceae archaeon]
MRLRTLTWGSDMALLVEAARELDIDLVARSVSDLDEDNVDECVQVLCEGDVILLHPSQDSLFDKVVEGVGKAAHVPVVSFGFDPSLWNFSTVSARIVSTVNAYVVYGGLENTRNMLKYLGRELLGCDYDYEPPKESLWQGLYHPDAKRAFANVDDYLKWYKPCHDHTVGILFFRTYWANGDLAIVNRLILELEKDFDVIPAFCFGLGDKDLGAKSSGEVVEEFFAGRVDAVVNLQSIFHAGSVDKSVEALKNLDVPVFHPLTVYHKSEAEWRENIHGMDSSEVGWSIALPEFEGLIEPIIAGASVKDQIGEVEFERHAGINDRIKKIARRVKRWINLRSKPPSERKVAFILHNNPCASAEATVGSGAHLDTLESVARILQRMREEGYAVENPPKDGKELIDTIMDRKAISEFRWTSVEEIVRLGGSLDLMDNEDYVAWFNTLPEDARIKVCEAWGQPPGEERDGVPPAMIHGGKIVAVSYTHLTL